MHWFSPRRCLKVPIHQVVSADTCIQGEVSFQGGLLVQGRVSGQLVPQGEGCSVTVASGGFVDTDVLEVDLAILNGQVRCSSIRAGRVVLGATARVAGDIRARSVEIHTGAVLDGRVSISDGREGEAGAKPAGLATAGA